ncbi:MAG: TetR family transcriptional regulator [Alphaproteobacteria bacterium]|nr:TetR family transcriptional regulator [Alphaproteobacteria bacterium]
MARLADPDLAVRRRQQILEAAEACFRRRGFHQATMQEICAEARISPGALYRYFDSKADIIAAISEEKRREAEEEFRKLFSERSFIDSLLVVAAKFLAKFAQADAGSLLCDIASEAARDPILARRLARIQESSIMNLAEAVADAQARGEIDPVLPPSDVARTLMTIFDGIGVRAAFNIEPHETILHQFRIVAERYLAPAAGAPT